LAKKRLPAARPKPRLPGAKRAFDIVLSATALVALSPVLAAIWLRMKVDADGPVLYPGVRVGLDGRQFRMYKFRSMVVNADAIGGPSTADDDPRLTRTGRTLRRYKLDELPQLVNVLRGDMSFVGPRPQVPQEVANYTEEERGLLAVRPGITDWASIRFHNEGEILAGHADPDAAYAELIRPEKMRLGLRYVREGTFRDDLRILWDTGVVAFGRKPRGLA
jgi:lipopolysaccharide/colanic/teichoic acid biosynthesis glycosyltransferase